MSRKSQIFSDNLSLGCPKKPTDLSLLPSFSSAVLLLVSGSVNFRFFPLDHWTSPLDPCDFNLFSAFC